MTEQEQQIAIAKALGATEIEFSQFGGTAFWPPTAKGMLERVGLRWCYSDERPGLIYGALPRFPNDLNAMHEVEKLLRRSVRERGEFGRVLTEICANDHSEGREYGRETWNATAVQRAEAFLRTIGKWKE